MRYEKRQGMEQMGNVDLEDVRLPEVDSRFVIAAVSRMDLSNAGYQYLLNDEISKSTDRWKSSTAYSTSYHRAKRIGEGKPYKMNIEVGNDADSVGEYRWYLWSDLDSSSRKYGLKESWCIREHIVGCANNWRKEVLKLFQLLWHSQGSVVLLALPYC